MNRDLKRRLRVRSRKDRIHRGIGWIVFEQAKKPRVFYDEIYTGFYVSPYVRNEDGHVHFLWELTRSVYDSRRVDQQISNEIVDTIEMAIDYGLDPVDGIPWEIHVIRDAAARTAATNAFLRSR